MIQNIVRSSEERAYRDSVRKKFEDFVTNVQFLLQAALNRKTGANLNQLRSRDIQGNLRNSVGDYLEGIKELAAQEFPLFFEYFSQVSFELSSKIDETAWQAIVAVQEYNLARDFESRMVFYLQKLELQQLDAVLKLLVLSHIKQRLERSNHVGVEENPQTPETMVSSKMDFFRAKL